MEAGYRGMTGLAMGAHMPVFAWWSFFCCWHPIGHFLSCLLELLLLCRTPTSSTIEVGRGSFWKQVLQKAWMSFPSKSWNTWLGNSFPSFGFQSVLLKAGIQKSPAPVWMGATLVLAWAPAVSVDQRRWISPFNCFIWKMMETIILCSFWKCQEYHVFKISLYIWGRAGTGAQTNLYIVWGENDVKHFFKGEIKGDRKVGSKIGGNGVSCLS